MEVAPQNQEEAGVEEVHPYQEVEEAEEDHFWHLGVVAEEGAHPHGHSCQGVVVVVEEHFQNWGVVEVVGVDQPHLCQGVEEGVVVHLIQMELMEEGMVVEEVVVEEVVMGLVRLFL